MSVTVYEEIESKLTSLSLDERKKLMTKLASMPIPASPHSTKATNGIKKQPLHPNTIWIKANKHEYTGNYVALKDGKLIAHGRTIKDADQAAKAKGVNDPLLHYIFPKDHTPWGGW